MASTTFETNGSTALTKSTEHGPATGFTRFPTSDHRWRDVKRADFLEHEITPCPFGEGFIFRLLDACPPCPKTGEESSRALYAWSKHDTYRGAVQASFLAGSCSYPDPEDDEGPEGEMEAAIPYYDPSTGHVEDTVRVEARA